MTPDEARALFDPAAPYLNTASYGLPPRPAWEALQAALADWRGGRTTWEPWGESTAKARELWAGLVGVPAERVATGATVSELVGLVAAALKSSSNSLLQGHVLAPEIEYTSLLWPWLAQGHDVATVPLAELVDRIDSNTAVVAVSAVQSSTGEVADLDAIAGAAHAHDAVVVVDATQAVGWLPFDGSRVDAVVGAGYKWLCSPRGTAWLALGERLLDRVAPLHASWWAGEDVYESYYGPPLRLARTARRLDTSPAWFSWVGCASALEVLTAVGVEPIRDHDARLPTASAPASGSRRRTPPSSQPTCPTRTTGSSAPASAPRSVPARCGRASTSTTRRRTSRRHSTRFAADSGRSCGQPLPGLQ